MKITELNQAPEYLTGSPVTPGIPFGSIIFGIPVQCDLNGRLILSPDGSLPISRSENVGATTALSVQTPFMIGTSFFNNKVQVRAGAIFSYLLRSTEVKQKFVAGAGNKKLVEYKDKSKQGFNELQAGAILQTTYLLGQQMGINFSVQKFCTAIYESAGEAAEEAKYNVLSLGLACRL